VYGKMSDAVHIVSTPKAKIRPKIKASLYIRYGIFDSGRFCGLEKHWADEIAVSVASRFFFSL
jgi:hypothetical protein